MKKLLLTLFIIFCVKVSAIQTEILILSNPEISDENSIISIDSLLQKKNLIDSSDVILVQGNLTKNGNNQELEILSNYLQKISKEYLLVPGENEFVNSESAGYKFTELFEQNNFIKNYDSVVLLGINTNQRWRERGHISKETFKWIDENLTENLKEKSIYIFSYYSPLEIDNWNKFIEKYQSFNFTNFFTSFNIDIEDLGKNKNKIYRLPNVSNNDYSFLTIDSTTSHKTFFDDNTENKIYELTNSKITHTTSSDKKIKDEVEIIFEYELETSLSSEPLFVDGNLFFVDAYGFAICMDTTGNTIWEYDTFGNVINKPIVTDGIFAVTTLQGDLITLNAETGESIQTIGFDESITSNIIVFDYNGSTNFMIPKESDSKAAVIIGTNTGKVYCLDLETLQEIWINDKPKGRIEKIKSINNKLFMGSNDGNIYSIDEQKGWLLWKWKDRKEESNSFVKSELVSDGKSIFFASSNRLVYSVDLLLGRMNWKNNKLNPSQSIGINNQKHRIFVKSRSDKFHIISARTSNWVKVINLKYGIDKNITNIFEEDKLVYFAAKNGFVYTIDSKFRYNRILNINKSDSYNIQKIDEDTYLYANVDGQIIIYKTK